MTDRALAIVPDSDLIEQRAAQFKPLFNKDATPEQLSQIAQVSLEYQLDPLTGELILYQGKAYVTASGRIRIADRHPAYDGYEDEIVTGDELTALQPRGNEIIWKCTVYRKDRTRPIRAYGRANGPNERNPVAKAEPMLMAQERAINRALKASFPIPIPGAEVEITDGQIKAIHAIDEDRGITVSERHDALEAQFGVNASNELTMGQASAYLDQRKAETATQPRETDVSGDWETALRSAATSQAVEAIWREMHDSGDQNKATKALMLECWGRCLLREEAEHQRVFLALLVDEMRKRGIDAYSKLNRKIVREIGEAVSVASAGDDAEYQSLINVDLEAGEVTDAS